MGAIVFSRHAFINLATCIRYALVLLLSDTDSLKLLKLLTNVILLVVVFRGRLSYKLNRRTDLAP